MSLPQVDGGTQGHQVAGLRPPKLGAEPGHRRQDQSHAHAEVNGPTGLHLLLDTATGVEVSPGISKARRSPARAYYLSGTSTLQSRSKGRPAGGTPIRSKARIRATEVCRHARPCQSCSRVRSQNSIGRGGFHRRGYREAMRIRLADFRQSGIF